MMAQIMMPQVAQKHVTPRQIIEPGSTMKEPEHRSVMVEEVLTGLNILPSGYYVDATFGRGGHSRAILERLDAKGRLWVMDRDPEALQVAHQLAKKDPRVTVCPGPFSSLSTFCKEAGLSGRMNGITLDLGVSSPQLEVAERGFSFIHEGPLDMRMDPTTGESAAEWLNHAEESEIAWVLKTYGEERFHRRIAHAIVMARDLSPLTSTLQLADIVAKANPAWEKHKNPATRSFQAIRIFINNELGELSLALEQTVEILAPQGRLAVISFHSLEDRIVKRFIQKYERGDEYPPGFPVIGNAPNQKLCRVGRKMKASLLEIEENIRARSAILRVAERISSV
jgi:16S rRNA (cytosine1402-N4)-methyltransferase